MGLIAWLVIGGLAGWIASMIMGTNNQQGCLMDIAIGIVGALIGGFVVNGLFGGGTPILDFSWISLIVAILGAVILLAIVKAVRGRSRT